MIRRQKLKTGATKLTFVLPLDEAPEATSVIGDFNTWDPLCHPMKKRSNGTRSASVEVPEGEVLQFRYLAEGGLWFNDADSDTNGEGNSVITA